MRYPSAFGGVADDGVADDGVAVPAGGSVGRDLAMPARRGPSSYTRFPPLRVENKWGRNTPTSEKTGKNEPTKQIRFSRFIRDDP